VRLGFLPTLVWIVLFDNGEIELWIGSTLGWICDAGGTTCSGRSWNGRRRSMWALVGGAFGKPIRNKINELGPSCSNVLNAPVYEESELQLQRLLVPMKHNTGVYLFRLDCSCRLVADDQVIIQPPLLCRQREGQSLISDVHLAISHVWSSVDDQLVAKATTVTMDLKSTEIYRRVREILDVKTLMGEHINLTDPKKYY